MFTALMFGYMPGCPKTPLFQFEPFPHPSAYPTNNFLAIK